ncbi:MAG: hypothetical protein LQ350_003907 [Teloschistes chrysophthalmus]|nr:MAG: hypothetical protein LQ350_003907 [Niorma chrysophthalma]
MHRISLSQLTPSPRSLLHLRPLTLARSPIHRPLASSSRHRLLSTSPSLSYPRKDSQDKDSINTEATEYSKSGTDDASARQDDTAFDPSTTDPHSQKEKVGEKTGSSDNPLEVSPANHEISKPRHSQEGGAENSSHSSNTESKRERSSGGGSPSKGSKVA